MVTFSNEFNKRLGQYTGSRSTPTSKEAISVDLASRIANAKRQKLTLGRDTPPKSASTAKGSEVSKDVNKLLMESDGFSTKSALSKLGSTVLDGGTRALDIISRPAYATFEAMKEQSESMNEGQNTLQSLDDIAGGFLSGLAGREKTGFGEVVEENAKRNSPSILSRALPYLGAGEGLNKIGEEHPDIAQNLKRTAGFLGEVGLDPLNYVGVGLIGKAGKGIKYSKEAMQSIARESTWKAVNKSAPALAKSLNTRKLSTLVGGGVDGKNVTRNLPKFNATVDNFISKALDDSVLELQRGLASGRFLGGDLMPQTIASKVTESLRSFKFEKFDKDVAKLLDPPKALTKSDIDKLDLDDFREILIKEYNSNPRYKNITIDDLPTKLNNSDALKQAVPRAIGKYKAQFDQTLKQIQDDILHDLSGQVYNAPALRVGNQKIALKGLDRIGKAYADARIAGKITPEALDGLSYGKKFPGRTALMNQRLRSMGIRKYEQFHGEVQEIANTFTKAEREAIHEAIIKGHDLPPKLQTGKEFVQQVYRDMWNEEVASGVSKRHAEAPNAKGYADNYAYIYYNKTKRGLADKARDTNRKTVALTGKLPPNVIQDGVNQGLKPVKDAFEAVLLRQIKSNRDMSRTWFMQDLIDHYGIKANRLSKKAVLDRGLQQVNSSLSDDLKRQLKPGDAWYLPSDIRGIYDEFIKSTSLGYSADSAALLRTYDKLTRMFKASATVPYVGFHLRNALGDIFMSSLDGVTFEDYARLMNQIKNARTGKTAQFRMGNTYISYDEAEKLFRENAASGGFYSTDLGVDQISAKVNPNRAYNKVREYSENREDFFRMAHFIKALRDEYPAAMKKASNPEIGIRNAAEAATYRVNKALFDYGALTRLEKTGLRRAIPFYTYSRKVMPTLLEAMILSPKNISRVNRFMIDPETKTQSDVFNPVLLPQFAREIGYSRLSNSEEPWILRADFLPTSVLRDNTNFSSAQGFSQNLLQNLNPILKGPAELAGGKVAFNDREIESSSDYLSSAAVPPLGPLTDIYNHIGGPDLSSIPGLGNVRGETSKTGKEIFSNRFLLGLPIDKITESQQTSSLYGLEDQLFEELNRVNDKTRSKGIRVYLSKRTNGASYRVRDEETGQVLYETDDPNAAAKMAESLAKKK